MRPLMPIALLLVAAPAAVFAADTDADALARIGAQIEQHPVIRAEFAQTKQMAAMKRPLVTSGRMVYSRRFGVLWQIERPYRASYVLGEEKMVEIGAEGSRRERGLREMPGMAQFSRIFSAMLGADTAALGRYFDTAAEIDGAKWEVEFKPRDAQLAQLLTGLKLTGGRFVDSIRIDEPGGDTTRIRFRNTQGASAPSAAELQLYGGAQAAPAEPRARP